VSESRFEAKPVEEVEMLGDKDVVATIAVGDIAVATEFNEGTPGLRRDPDGNILDVVNRSL
jgi:hypothetical protein